MRGGESWPIVVLVCFGRVWGSLFLRNEELQERKSVEQTVKTARTKQEPQDRRRVEQAEKIARNKQKHSDLLFSHHRERNLNRHPQRHITRSSKAYACN